MAYEMVMPYHLHMPSYILGTFTEYPLEDVRSIMAEKHFDTLSFSVFILIGMKIANRLLLSGNWLVYWFYV